MCDEYIREEVKELPDKGLSEEIRRDRGPADTQFYRTPVQAGL